MSTRAHVLVGLLGVAACQPPPPEPPKGVVPPGCTGEYLDLAQVFSQGSCVVAEATEAPSAAQLRLELSPAPLDLAPGAVGQIELVMINASGADLAFDLTIPCEPALGFPMQVATATGDQSLRSGDPAVEDARSGTACQTQQVVRVGLPPTGRAKMPLSIRACAAGTVEPCGLPAGAHPLAVQVPLPRVRPAAGVLRVATPQAETTESAETESP